MGRKAKTETQIIDDLNFIYNTYGKFTSTTINESNKTYDTISLRVLESKYGVRDNLYKLIGAKNNKKTFYDWCIENDKKEFLDTWDYNKNDCSPKDILYSAHKKYYFICNNCKISQKYYINSFTNMGTSLHCIHCNSFEKWCIENNKQDLIDRWDYDKNTVNKNILPKASKQKIWF